MQVASINGVHLHYRLKGSQSKIPVVFSNSLGTDFRIWDRVTTRLASKIQALCYDKRGHGLSEVTAAPYRLEEHVHDLAGLLKYLNLKQVVVCGVSVGGMIALGLAATHPELVRGLVLCDTSHKIGPPEMWNQRIEHIQNHGIASLADAVIERWFSEDYRRSHSEELVGWRNMLINTPIAGYTGTCAALRDADLTNDTRNLRLPALCLCGENDQGTTPELVRSMAALIPGSQFQVIKKAGHLPNIEAPDDVSGLIESFIKGV